MTDGNTYEDITTVSMDVKGQPENKVRLLFVSAEPTTIAIKGSGGGRRHRRNRHCKLPSARL